MKIIISSYGPDEDIISMRWHLDPTEKEVFEKYCAGADVTYSDQLEAITGADMMLTPLGLPIAPVFMAQHFKAGAIMVQVKRGADIVASVGDRMSFSQGKMIEAMHNAGLPRGTQNSWQKVLLFVGKKERAADKRTIVIDGRPHDYGGTHSWASVQGSINAWCMRGGTYQDIADMTCLPEWLDLVSNKLLDFINNREKVVMPLHPNLYASGDELSVSWAEKDAPMQDIVVVRDFRCALMTIPQMGEKKVQSLYAYMQLNDKPLNLIQALMILTDPHQCEQVPMLSVNLSMRTRKWLGLKGAADAKGNPLDDNGQPDQYKIFFELLLVS